MIVFESPSYGVIHKRYKRFLADIELPSGEIITAHVPNTGSMRTCWEPGQKVLLSRKSGTDRKYPFTLEMVHNGQTWIGVNTANSNKIVKYALQHQEIEAFNKYCTIIPEQKIGKSKIDFFLPEHGGLYIEVKNVTLLGINRMALFPDAVTERGQKHVHELIELKKAGFRAAMIYTIQREDVDAFSPSTQDDPVYSKLLKEAFELGVEIYPIRCKINEKGIGLGELLPLKL